LRTHVEIKHVLRYQWNRIVFYDHL